MVYLPLRLLPLTKALTNYCPEEMKNVLKVHPADNVIVALQDLKKGSVIPFEGEDYTLIEDIAAKHKFVTHDLAVGDEVIMYGVLVGKASKPIPRGASINTFNLKHAAAPFKGKSKEYHWEAPDVSAFKDKTFMGFHRPNGKVGTANYWLFIPTVFCENRNLEFIKTAFENQLGYKKTDRYEQYAGVLVEYLAQGKSLADAKLAADGAVQNNHRIFENIDGIKFLTHQMGCGGTRQDSSALAGLLAGYATHPNVCGVTVLSLGCQHMQVAELKAEIEKRANPLGKPLLVFEQQEIGTEEELMESAMRETFAALVEANKQTRQPASLDKLVLGVKCGGSDGFSGISANPAVGYAADMLVALGGSVVLAEFPELCGVEQELADRCETPELAEKFITLMKTYAAQAESVGSGFDMNPSPGNIKDGLITDAIKSAGAAKKGGNAPVADVLDYTEPVKKPGLSLLCTPGNDVEATTGKAGSGSTLILFTTGLGTPTGNPVCPVIKVSTNHALTKRMPDIIDIDTGSVITGEDSIASMGHKILDFCIEVASGRVIPKAVALGQDDFIPWKRGVSL